MNRLNLAIAFFLVHLHYVGGALMIDNKILAIKKLRDMFSDDKLKVSLHTIPAHGPHVMGLVVEGNPSLLEAKIFIEEVMALGVRVFLEDRLRDLGRQPYVR